jgi:ATP-dependent Clp protease ATP-binding subunit ClpC
MTPGVPNLTERSRKALELAQSAARNDAVSPLHLVLGLIQEGGGVAVTALRFHGVAIEGLVEELTVLAADSAAGRREPGIDALLSAAHAESESMDHPYVGTEHLLLALLRDPGSTTARALARHGMTYHDAKARILRILSADPMNPGPFAPPSAVIS